MTAGSDGVTCPNLDELYEYANSMESGQKITCSRFLKGMDRNVTFQSYFNFNLSFHNYFEQTGTNCGSSLL